MRRTMSLFYERRHSRRASDPSLPCVPITLDPVATNCVFSVLLLPYAIIAVVLLSLASVEYVIRLGPCSNNDFCKLEMIRIERACRFYLRTLACCIVDTAIIGINYMSPLLQIHSSDDQRRNREKSRQLCTAIQDEIQHCKEVPFKLREQRRQNMKLVLAEGGLILPDQMQLCCDDIEKTRRLKSHVETLEEDLENIDRIAETEAIADRTGYDGVVDWAQKMLKYRKDLMEAVCQVSFVGAGLTYGTIFSATRGNIGLMCYAFALFNCGFTIPLITIALLRWFAAMKSREIRVFFASPPVWTIMLNVFLYFSIFAAVAAVCLLNVTILLLHFPNVGGVPSDSPAQYNIAPRPAGNLALMCAAASCATTVFALAMHYMANGLTALYRDLSVGKKDRRGLDKYIPQ